MRQLLPVVRRGRRPARGLPLPRRPARGCAPTWSRRWTARRCVTAGPAALSGPADQQVFGVLRGLADVVLVGAGTARAEGYRALRAEADVRRAAGRRSASGRRRCWRWSPAGSTSTRARSCSTAAASAPSWSRRRTRTREARASAGRGGRRASSPARRTSTSAAALDELAGRGLTRVLCEGGPSLLADLVAGRPAGRAVPHALAAAGRRLRPQDRRRHRARRRLLARSPARGRRRAAQPLRRRLIRAT